MPFLYRSGSKKSFTEQPARPLLAQAQAQAHEEAQAQDDAHEEAQDEAQDELLWEEDDDDEVRGRGTLTTFT